MTFKELAGLSQESLGFDVSEILKSDKMGIQTVKPWMLFFSLKFPKYYVH